MENKRVEIIKKQELVLYTKDELIEHIQVIPEDYAKDTPEAEMARRDLMHKLKVLQSILCLELPPYDFENDNIEDIKKALEVHVDGNELLFSYTFFLSSNKNFDYTWSYLRRQMDKYIDFLSDAYRFISYAVADINAMKTVLSVSGIENLHIELNELFDVRFIDDKPFINTIVNWDKFNQINNVRNGYYISIKLDKTTLLTNYRKYSHELNPFLNGVKEVLVARKEQSEKKE